ncbi:hypothetical protein [Shewanella nanhaiensis]|uniref:Uncharacterized protein n=1 Tax=Shewanella nanhaiensis TaxID=2864872 RepID=A0ABS7EAJ6_9GAMM|nr:hypothetical protein [Shewanella nanhaiensis]MBW8186181.1 hypothetical protein [Shewanella nanhaiensis]
MTASLFVSGLANLTYINWYWEAKLKKWLIVLSCTVFVAASLLTSGLTRALIDLVAFASLLWIVLGMRTESDTKQDNC